MGQAQQQLIQPGNQQQVGIQEQHVNRNLVVRGSRGTVELSASEQLKSDIDRQKKIAILDNMQQQEEDEASSHNILEKAMKKKRQHDQQQQDNGNPVRRGKLDKVGQSAEETR